MKATTAIGIGTALAGLLLGAMMEGTNVAALINIPAMLIVFGGTLGVTIASTSFDRIKAIPMLYKTAIGGAVPDMKERATMLVAFSERARRDGLLALDEELEGVDDQFTRKGMQLVVDGTDPELVREVLETEIDGMEARHHGNASPFEKAGAFAPTMGIIGTVMGLVHVLENLDAPETLGPSISGAFIATLFGVGAANVVFLPVAYRLKQLSAEEVQVRVMTVEGILAIQAGENPRIVAEKLQSFVPPAERDSPDEDEAGGEGLRAVA